MSSISTKLTRLLNIRTPVVSAAMAGASGGRLAAQVTAGGGFGFLSAGYEGPEQLTAELSLARSSLQLGPSSPLPIGVGYLGWQLEKKDSPVIEVLQLALENRVKAVWFSFGSQLGRWVQFVRDYDQKNRGESEKTIIFAQISSIQDALIAVNEWKIDVLVVQGIEAGGHGPASAAPIHTLVPSIISAFPDDAPPVLAAGGLANGSDIATMLGLRASGVVMGTRFLLTPECLYTDAQRQALVAAKAGSTIRTMAFDHARGTLGWPDGVDGRALRNSTVDDLDGGADLEGVRSKFELAVQNGDPNRMLVWAGTGIGRMDSVKPAQEVVKELHQETLQCLEEGRNMKHDYIQP